MHIEANTMAPELCRPSASERILFSGPGQVPAIWVQGGEKIWFWKIFPLPMFQLYDFLFVLLSL